jgi:hypothetical protein
LTKPDCLPSGSGDDTLRNILAGHKYQLGHGYFVLKNLAQDAIDRGLSSKDARIQERIFFETTVPWGTTLKNYSNRFGAENLQDYLAKILVSDTEQQKTQIFSNKLCCQSTAQRHFSTFCSHTSD